MHIILIHTTSENLYPNQLYSWFSDSLQIIIKMSQQPLDNPQAVRQRIGERKIQQQPKLRLMFSERMKTFQLWPKQMKQTPTDMAAQGFIYTGLSDAVMCVFCFVKISEWDAADKVCDEHKKHRPSCVVVSHDTPLTQKCCVCLEEKVKFALTCGHTFCTGCVLHLDTCGQCRNPIEKIIPLYFSVD